MANILPQAALLDKPAVAPERFLACIAKSGIEILGHQEIQIKTVMTPIEKNDIIWHLYGTNSL
jgi:hypothetical protein